MDKAKLWTNEGQPNNIQVFFSKSRFILNPRSCFPLRGSCRLQPTEEVFACLPLALRQAFPLGGSSLQSKVMRGSRTTFRHFLFKKPLYIQPLSWLPPTEEVSLFLCNPSPCLKKIQQTSFFRQKLSTASCFPLSSTLSPSKAFPPYSFFVVISRLSSLRLFPSASIPVFHPTRSFQKPFLLAILSLRIVVFAGSTIIIS